jgi:hypothetical protein
MICTSIVHFRLGIDPHGKLQITVISSKKDNSVEGGYLERTNKSPQETHNRVPPVSEKKKKRKKSPVPNNHNYPERIAERHQNVPMQRRPKPSWTVPGEQDPQTRSEPTRQEDPESELLPCPVGQLFAQVLQVVKSATSEYVLPLVQASQTRFAVRVQAVFKPCPVGQVEVHEEQGLLVVPTLNLPSAHDRQDVVSLTLPPGQESVNSSPGPHSILHAMH